MDYNCSITREKEQGFYMMEKEISPSLQDSYIELVIVSKMAI